ncbi:MULTISPECIES: hypothetical protein [unclassified Aurantimonas]|uniref:hypothetical protein n=1 Tax=unclassified Aurantimonas TaxID=2638230 RepID=UPI002E1913FE|nr:MULTISPECIES: hypothetical protein [unclassified Aurantimonas]MEC5291598.1 hypothetical protein [Aurantimonas sp. C2-3-R2]MEC5412682.1 hypothetical protein [Aurantimonas sp. C2-4-R8]
MKYDISAAEQYIRQAAAERGVDPDTAVRVARSEGLQRGTWQSNATKNGVREPSFGPFQLLVGGEGTGFPTGMGNDFIQRTGLDPSDPKNLNAAIDFALDGAKQNGWGAWYGAKAAGIGNRQGIGGRGSAPSAAPRAMPQAAPPAAGASALMSPTPIAQQMGTLSGPAPALFGDVVAPNVVQAVPVPQPTDFASYLAQRKQAEAEAQAADQQRKLALFGDDLFGIYS